MFEAISNFFTWISDIGDGLLTFFHSVLNGLKMMVSAFPRIISFVTGAVTYVPTIFSVFITITVIVSIVYLILGREAGSSE